MATQTFTGITAQSGFPAFLGQTDNAEIAADAFLASTSLFDSAVWSTGSNQTIDVYGTVYGRTYSIQAGTSGTSTNQTINVYAGASVLAGGGISISASNSTLTNAGKIAGAYGLYYNGAASGDGGTITNSGIIAASGNDDYYAAIYNSGEEKLTTVNTGVLQGSIYAYIGSEYEEAVDDLTNSGRIAGAVKFGGGDDRYDGRLGTISGAIYGEAGNDTLLGGTGNETLDGGDGNDTLDGGAGADTLVGGAGDDSLDGGTGADAMAGGAGDDTYYVDNAADTVTEAAGEGTDLVIASRSWTLGANIENLTLTGSGNLSGTGNTLANVITGNDGDNALSGGAGNDTLYGNAGYDTLDGGAGADRMEGGAGNDTYYVDNSGDVVVEASGAGTDTVSSSISYTLTTNVETLVLTGSGNLSGKGNASANTITGNTGNNTLRGEAGNDILTGGKGADKLYGGTGADRFVFKALSDSTVSSSGRDMIYDFSHSQGDRIDLSAIDASTKSSGNQAFSFIGEKAYSGKAGELRYVNSGGDTFIYGDVNGDKKSDFAIKIDANIDLVKGDFIL
ncbi:calcium-binding protein [Ciceribacter sp. L1K22]|uniref:calcium-binding protein n=1 Tax=Ciceribacter sp. L1K22 TaxID=2820275 RepID=UPI001ABE1E67|nr:calcium-binding protein [Ciceribacter sp. L1K22]MBO3759450.1 calcium-binding protein [Ciceribacter sp. L1K22]